jgi:hypothetical protein
LLKQVSISALTPDLAVCGVCVRAVLSAGAAALEPEQLQKVEAEASVIAEIQQLGGTV